MQRIFDFWIKRKAWRKKREFNDGYDFAAGALLRGEKSPLELVALCWPDNSDPFDKGMTEATNKLISLGLINDNRM